MSYTENHPQHQCKRIPGLTNLPKEIVYGFLSGLWVKNSILSLALLNVFYRHGMGDETSIYEPLPSPLHRTEEWFIGNKGCSCEDFFVYVCVQSVYAMVHC